MAAIDDARKAMAQLHDKHEKKFINLFTGHVGEFWTKETNMKQPSLFPETKHHNWSVFILHDGRPDRVERFQTRAAARDFRNKILGGKPIEMTGGKAEQVSVIGRNASGLKVERTCVLTKATSDLAKKLEARLPKVATKIRKPKEQSKQLGMFE